MTDKEKDIRHSPAPKFKKDIPMPPVKPAPTMNCNKEQKTRENELHEPKIDIYEVTLPDSFFGNETIYHVGYKCAVCGEGRMELAPYGVGKQKVIERFKRNMDNYCPNCGARLKEVKE